MIVRAVLTVPDLIDTMDVFNDGKDTKNWLMDMGEVELANRVDARIEAMYRAMRPADDNPFVVRLPGTELYWSKGSAWDERSRATVYRKRGPDLSLGERVMVTEDEAASLSAG